MCTAQLGPDNYSVSYASLPDLKVSIGNVEELRDCSLSDPVQRVDFLVSMRVVPLWRPRVILRVLTVQVHKTLLSREVRHVSNCFSFYFLPHLHCDQQTGACYSLTFGLCATS